MGKMKKRGGNPSFKELDKMGVNIKPNQGEQFNNPKFRGKNNVFNSGVEAF